MIILDWIFDFLINKILYSYKPICHVSLSIKMTQEFMGIGKDSSVKEYMDAVGNSMYYYCFELVHPEKIVSNPRIIENILKLKENDDELKRFKEDFHLHEENSKYIENIRINFYYNYKNNPYVDTGIDLELNLPKINSLATDKDIEFEYSIIKHYGTGYDKDYSEDIDMDSFKDFKRLVFYTSLLRRLKRDSLLK